MEIKELFALIKVLVACINAICNVYNTLNKNAKITASFQLSVIFLTTFGTNRLQRQYPFSMAILTLQGDFVKQNRLFFHFRTYIH